MLTINIVLRDLENALTLNQKYKTYKCKTGTFLSLKLEIELSAGFYRLRLKKNVKAVTTLLSLSFHVNARKLPTVLKTVKKKTNVFTCVCVSMQSLNSSTDLLI